MNTETSYKPCETEVNRLDTNTNLLTNTTNNYNSTETVEFNYKNSKSDYAEVNLNNNNICLLFIMYIITINIIINFGIGNSIYIQLFRHATLSDPN